MRVLVYLELGRKKDLGERQPADLSPLCYWLDLMLASNRLHFQTVAQTDSG